MPITPGETAELIAQYAGGPDILRTALANVPAVAMQWRPVEGEWSIYEQNVPQLVGRHAPSVE